MNNRLTLFIDSCAWNILFSNSVNLSEEFPFDSFDLAMTKEVSAFEIDPISNAELRAYIEEQVRLASIREDSFFGFCSMSDPPGYKSRVGGFDEGRWMTYEDGIAIQKFKVAKSNLKKTGLYKDEADASLAVRAATGSIVLTAERDSKNGPLKRARLAGGVVIDVSKFKNSETSFREFVMQAIGNERNICD